MNTRKTPARHIRLAETLAVILQHPKTPANCACVFRLMVSTVAELANTSAATIYAPRPGIAQMDLITAALDFGLAMADVLADEQLDVEIWNELGDCTGQIEDLLIPESGQKAESSRLRAVLTEWARIQRESFPSVAVSAAA